MELRAGEVQGGVSTVYLGGGTPSQLSAGQLRQLFVQLGLVFGLAGVKEVTIECNPDDVTADFAAMLQHLPVNRVSMGVQNFSNERLRFLRRRHTAEQIATAVNLLRSAGVGNISIDLMYGLPGQTLSDWHQDIDAALRLNVQHLSAYSLMFEEGTVLDQKRQEENRNGGGKHYQPVDEELERQMFYDLIDRLYRAGYEHYEISNFAKPGFRSLHNSNYWNGTPYVGLGAAAHGYDGDRRRYWNMSDVEQYVCGVEQGQCFSEGEELDADTRYNEQVMTALRTSEGISLSRLSPSQRTYCLGQARRFLLDGSLACDDDCLHLTRKGLFVSNMIMSELMIV